MEIFNVAMATAGMHDMKRLTSDEYLRFGIIGSKY